jgi:signal transduction histidine kinase
VGNAVQHSPPGSHILVRARSDGDRMVAEVHNEGHIAADLLPNIFDPFRSGSSPSSREGLGLGLFIARAIARAHQGSIEVESDAGSGTTFRLVLPRRVTRPAQQRV